MQRTYEGSAGMESEEVFLTEKTNEGVLSPLLEVPQVRAHVLLCV